ncbi:MAG: hypothetical protein RL331_268 [Bacteroidota bacterium]
MRKLYLKLFFLVFSALGTSAFAQYCTPTFVSGCSFGDQILNFNTTGGASNITNNGSGCSAGYYQYFTGQTVSQLQGQDVTLNMQAGPTWGQGFKVWIDWNNNQSFADAGELVYTSPGSGVAVNSAVVTVPFSATTGTVRMRVVCSYAGIPLAMDGCPTNQSYGECEDYDFVVLASAACSGTPTAGTAVTSSATICPSVDYTLSLSGATLAAGLSYQWQSAPSATGPWTNITAGTTPNFITSQTVDTWYQCIVTCSGQSATSSVVGVTTNSFLACYCTSTATSTFDEEILNVTLNTLNNTSTCGVAAPGPGSTASLYSNYTTLTPTILSPGVVYPLSVEIGTCNGSYTNCTKVWIDFNQNGLFTDAGENVYTSAATSVGPHFELGNITIPSGAISGNTLMRVVNVETWDPANINPCGTYTWGETEDYLVNISAPPTCPQPTNFSLIQANNIIAQVEWIAGGTETQWQIEYGPQGFTPGSGTSVIVTTNPYTITGLTANSFYQAYIQGICTPGDTSYFTPPVAWNTYNQGQFVDWDNACPTNGFEDIAGFATNANLTDDSEAGVTLPFTFLYQGILMNTMTIGNNGGVILGSTTAQVNYNMPASGNGLFPFIQDLGTATSPNGVYYGQVGNSPNAKFIVQWNNVPHYGFPTPTNGASFQLVIEEATNEIYYVYDDVEMGNTAWDNGADAEIGLRGPNNVNVSLNNTAYLQDNSCVHFYYTNCPKPTTFATSYVAPDEAMITWTAGAAAETNWTIIYGPTGFNPATGGTTTTSTANSAILTGLAQLTTYDVYIYADCAVGLQSLGLEGSFTTPPFCSNPTNLFASTEVDSLISSWSWTGYSALYPSTSFNLQLVQPGGALYSGAIYNLDNNTTDTTYDAEFMAGQTFDVYVQAVCGQDTSFYVGPFNVVFPLTNDTLCGAQMIPVNGQMYMFNNTGATFDVAELAMVPPATGAQTTTGWANQNLEMTTWFKFIAPPSGAVRINCTGVAYNGQMAVYGSPNCSNIAGFQMMAANDDDLGGMNQAPNFTVCGMTPGTEYYMMHDAFNFTAGNHAIQLYEIVLNAGVEGEQLEVCYGDTVNLFLGIANYQLEGTWSETTPTLGLNDNLFNTNGLASTLYEFTYTVQDGCASDAANAYVQIYSAPNPGVGGTINVCLNEPFNLVSGISGLVDLDGVWYNNASMETLPSSVDTSGATGGNVTYTYTASNGVCPDESTTVTVVVNNGCDFTAGIDELAAGFELYPNPTRSSVAISWRANGETTLTLTDLNGKVLLNAVSQASQYAMDLSNFAPGVYIVTVQNGDQLLTERIIKQ